MEGCQTWCDGHHVILKKKSNSSSADQGMVSGKTRTSMALTWPRLWRDVQSRGSEFDLMAMPGWHEGFKEVELWILCVGSPGSTSYWAGCLIWTSWFCILSYHSHTPSIEALLLQVSDNQPLPLSGMIPDIINRCQGAFSTAHCGLHQSRVLGIQKHRNEAR